MDTQVEDIKQFLYSWLGKQKKTPNYEVTQATGKNNKTRFKSEVRVDGFAYIGIGNSTSKKDSQSNAALDFCQFLVRSGMLNQKDIPAMVKLIINLAFYNFNSILKLRHRPKEAECPILIHCQKES